MEFRLLGGLELQHEGRTVALGTTKQRTLLAYLLLHANQYVAITELINALWSGRPPESARKNLQLYISRLRRIFDDERLAVQLLTNTDSYRASLDVATIDVMQSEALHHLGVTALHDGALHEASARLSQAIELWTGSPLCGLDGSVAMRAEVICLEETHLALSIDYYDAVFASGQYARHVPDLIRLVKRHPYQERLREQLMIALWQSGQRDKALASYREAHGLMARDLGLEPSWNLKKLHQAILRDTTSSDYPRPTAVPPTASLTSGGFLHTKSASEGPRILPSHRRG